MAETTRRSLTLARTLQADAEQLYRDLNDDSLYGLKCWYGDAALVVRGTRRVFIGINPAGGREAQAVEEDRGDYLRWPYSKPGYNAWLDDTWWTGNGPAHQAAVRMAFGTLYGRLWETELRATACFNLGPLPQLVAGRPISPRMVSGCPLGITGVGGCGPTTGNLQRQRATPKSLGSYFQSVWGCGRRGDTRRGSRLDRFGQIWASHPGTAYLDLGTVRTVFEPL